MSTVFTRDFDLELAQEVEQRAYVARASVTPEELDAALEAARAEAFAQGHAAGVAEGQAQANATLHAREAETLDALAPRLDALFATAAEHRAALEAQTLDFALSVCEQTFPELLRERALARSTAQIRRTMSLALGSPVLRIALPAEAEPRLRGVIEAAAAARGYAGRIDITPDDTLSPGDLRVGWDNGFLDYSFTAVCDRIRAALAASRDALTETPAAGNDAHA